MIRIFAMALAVLSLAAATAPPAEAQVAGNIRFQADPGVTLTVHEIGRYGDTVALVPGPRSGMQVVNELSLDAYIEGLGEMPASWPREALRAQAVAARSYAWWESMQGIWYDQGYDFDICATVTCQVFHGREIVETPGVGALWKEAVDSTAGEVLTYEGRPILARFFSSSGGATRPNEHVFPEDGHRPYLRAVEDPHDAEASPLAHWQVAFTREQMNAILARGSRLSAVAPFADIERILSDGTRPDLVRVTGKNGEVVEVKAWEFRTFVSPLAAELFPDHFPQARSDGGPMPATIPTSRMDFTVTDDAVMVDGYGWGHAVGMSQYGAKGKAEDGWTYDDILATYYGGIRPDTHPEAPERVRVGVRWDVPAVTVEADGPVTVLHGDREVRVEAGGTWEVAVGDDGQLHFAAEPAWGERTSESRRQERPEMRPADSEAGRSSPDLSPAANTAGRGTLGGRVLNALEHAAPVIRLIRFAFGR